MLSASVLAGRIQVPILSKLVNKVDLFLFTVFIIDFHYIRARV